MTIDQRRLSKSQSDLALTSAYLAALQTKFPNPPDSQLIYAAAKMAGNRRLEDALLPAGLELCWRSAQTWHCMEELA